MNFQASSESLDVGLVGLVDLSSDWQQGFGTIPVDLDDFVDTAGQPAAVDVPSRNSDGA
jgi:hypothetical protein